MALKYRCLSSAGRFRQTMVPDHGPRSVTYAKAPAAIELPRRNYDDNFGPGSGKNHGWWRGWRIAAADRTGYCRVRDRIVTFQFGDASGYRPRRSAYPVRKSNGRDPGRGHAPDQPAEDEQRTIDPDTDPERVRQCTFQ